MRNICKSNCDQFAKKNSHCHYKLGIKMVSWSVQCTFLGYKVALIKSKTESSSRCSLKRANYNERGIDYVGVNKHLSNSLLDNLIDPEVGQQESFRDASSITQSNCAEMPGERAHAVTGVQQTNSCSIMGNKLPCYAFKDKVKRKRYN